MTAAAARSPRRSASASERSTASCRLTASIRDAGRRATRERSATVARRAARGLRGRRRRRLPQVRRGGFRRSPHRRIDSAGRDGASCSVIRRIRRPPRLRSRPATSPPGARIAPRRSRSRAITITSQDAPTTFSRTLDPAPRPKGISPANWTGGWSSASIATCPEIVSISNTPGSRRRSQRTRTPAAHWRCGTRHCSRPACIAVPASTCGVSGRCSTRTAPTSCSADTSISTRLSSRSTPRDDPVEEGIRSFVVGTGGARLYGFWNPPYASRARILKHGVLRLSLDDGAFAWQFIRVDGGVADAGEARCRWSDPSDLAPPNPTDPTTGTD